MFGAMIIRALFMALIGMIVSSAIVANSLVCTVHEIMANEPVGGTPPLMRPTLSALSLIAIALGIRAFKRESTNPQAHRILHWGARAVPVLLLVGTTLGVALAFMEFRDVGKRREEWALSLCEDVLEETAPMQSCVPVGVECLRQGRVHDRQQPANLRRIGRDLEKQCIHEQAMKNGWPTKKLEK
jgi:hypothetical protein